MFRDFTKKFIKKSNIFPFKPTSLIVMKYLSHVTMKSCHLASKTLDEVSRENVISFIGKSISLITFEITSIIFIKNSGTFVFHPTLLKVA